MTAGGRQLEHLVVYRSERLVIREKHTADAADDYAWRRDPEIARYDGREPITEPFSEFLARMEYDLRFKNPRERLYAVDTLTGEHIGNVMYYNAGEARHETEVGITIGRPDYRGRGYGREAILAFVRFLWETTPFRRIVLHTLDWNERAIRCFAGAGFTESGVLERQGMRLVRMEAQREWWLLRDMEGAFDRRPANAPDHIR